MSILLRYIIYVYFVTNFFNLKKTLVIPPPVPTISKCPSTATEDVFQGSSLGTQWACWCLCYAPYVQIWRAWKHVIHCLNEEFDAVRLGFSKLSPGHFPFNLEGNILIFWFKFQKWSRNVTQSSHWWPQPWKDCSTVLALCCTGSVALL